jgi:hypothetical protein
MPASVEATRHVRRSPRPRQAARRDVKAARPVSAVSASIRCRLIHPPVAHTHAIEPEKTTVGMHGADLWKPVVFRSLKASPRTLAVTGHRKHQPQIP